VTWEKIKTFFDTPSLLLFLVSLVVVIFAIQWVAWIFGLGRFKAATTGEANAAPTPGSGQTPIRHVIANLFVKVIDDFRHLLALIIIVMFAITLVYSLYVAGTEADKISESLQAVTGSLSGIIGVIIGYYFGESAAKRAADDSQQPIVIEPDDNDQADPDAPPPTPGANRPSGSAEATAAIRPATRATMSPAPPPPAEE
jgi:hypothetical protein